MQAHTLTVSAQGEDGLDSLSESAQAYVIVLCFPPANSTLIKKQPIHIVTRRCPHLVQVVLYH